MEAVNMGKVKFLQLAERDYVIAVNTQTISKEGTDRTIVINRLVRRQ